MAATPSIRIVTTSGFKGGTRQWSNRYHFSGGTPADSTHWTTLTTAIVNSFKPCLTSGHTITESLGYAAGSDVPVFTEVLSVAGTGSFAGTPNATPLQNAALIRWSTAARSTKNHPIYCFSYIHGVVCDNAVAGFDKLITGQRTALQTYAAAWVTGFSDGTITCKRSSPTGHDATGYIVEEYATHRDFPPTTSV